MEDDWDLHAVVRGRTTTSGDASAADTTTNNNPFPSYNSSVPDFNDDGQSSFDNFPGLIDDRGDPFQGLQEIYREFCVDPPRATTSGAAVSAPAGHDFGLNREIVQIQSAPVQMRQENMQFRINSPSVGSSSQNFPVAVNPQPIRQRRRKNQQMKMVRQMTQEELSTDSWAWRKYGQKPIKGSPYPRNYYRCSTSKGCAARKQVERSPTDPAIFIVSYSGEHTHPRPAHRSSLAGSTRSKFSPQSAAAAVQSNNTGNALLLQKGSSPASGSSFSPTTPLVEGEAAAQNDDVEMAEEEDAAGEEEEEENIVMIQNDLMNDDEGVFKGFQDSDHSSGGGDFFSSGMLSSPPWTPTSSSANTAGFRGGGGD